MWNHRITWRNPLTTDHVYGPLRVTWHFAVMAYKNHLHPPIDQRVVIRMDLWLMLTLTERARSTLPDNTINQCWASVVCVWFQDGNGLSAFWIFAQVGKLDPVECAQFLLWIGCWCLELHPLCSLYGCKLAWLDAIFCRNWLLGTQVQL